MTCLRRVRLKFLLASPRSVRRACLGLALAAIVAHAASPALALSALDQDWQQFNLPQRDTVVEVETNFGLYRLPIGYLNFPGLLKRHEVATDPSSGQHRYRLIALLFHFTMPDGHQNTAGDWNLRGGDPGGDNIGIDPRRYVVGITRMEPPERLHDEVVVLASGMPPDHLEPILPPELSAKTHDYAYRGWTQTASTRERVGVEISCAGVRPAEGLNGHCLGHMFLEQQNLDLEFPLNIDRVAHVFEIVDETCRLLREWQVR